MKQMSLIEMDGLLKGKCIPRDLKVNETNAEYIGIRNWLAGIRIKGE